MHVVVLFTNSHQRIIQFSSQAMQLPTPVYIYKETVILEINQPYSHILVIVTVTLTIFYLSVGHKMYMFHTHDHIDLTRFNLSRFPSKAVQKPVNHVYVCTTF